MPNKSSFATNVDRQDLYELVDEVVKRFTDKDYEFEHLTLSQSKFHSLFQKYHESTFLLVKRIMKDFEDVEFKG